MHSMHTDGARVTCISNHGLCQRLLSVSYEFTQGGCSIDTMFNNDILAISTEMMYYIFYYTFRIIDVVQVYIYFLLRLSSVARGFRRPDRHECY